MAGKAKATQKRKPQPKAKAARKAPANASGKSGGGVSGLHTLHQDDPFTINYAGHDARTDSPLYAKSRKLLTEITKSTDGNGGTAWVYGAGPWEDHHGGGLWVHDGKGWFFLKNLAGMEWASQFCADPAKVERLRQNAARLYQGAFYDNTKAQVLKLDSSYPFDQVLKTPITNAKQMADWTDSIFNASVPLPKPNHTGVSPKGHGVHHYPTPVYDIDFFKHDDFVLWVLDDEKQPAAVVPVHPRGVDKSDPKYAANYGKVEVTYATPGTKLDRQLSAARSKRARLVADSGHRLTKQAFREQS